jgi:phage-related protein
MFDIVFYKNRSGKEPVLEYIQELSGRTDKDSQIKLHDYINYLGTEGKKAGEPYMKHKKDAENPTE